MLTKKGQYRFLSAEALKNVSVNGRPYPLRDQLLVPLGEDEAFVEEAIRERLYVSRPEEGREEYSYCRETDGDGSYTGKTVTTYRSSFAPCGTRIRKVLGSMGLLLGGAEDVKDEHRVGGKTVVERIAGLVDGAAWYDRTLLADVPFSSPVTLIDWRRTEGEEASSSASSSDSSSSSSSSEEASSDAETAGAGRACRFPYCASVTDRVFADLDRLQAFRLAVGSVDGVGVSTLRFDAHKRTIAYSSNYSVDGSGGCSTETVKRVDGAAWDGGGWTVEEEGSWTFVALGQRYWAKTTDVRDSLSVSLFVGKRLAVRNAAGGFAVEKVTADVVVSRTGSTDDEGEASVEHCIVRAYPVTFLPSGVPREDDLKTIDDARESYEWDAGVEERYHANALRDARKTLLEAFAEADEAYAAGERAALGRLEEATAAAHMAFLSGLSGGMAVVNATCREEDAEWIAGGREGTSAAVATMDAWESGPLAEAKVEEEEAVKSAREAYEAELAVLDGQRKEAKAAAQERHDAAVGKEDAEYEEDMKLLADELNESVNAVSEAEVARSAKTEADYEAAVEAAEAVLNASRATAWGWAASGREKLDAALKSAGLGDLSSADFNLSDRFWPSGDDARRIGASSDAETLWDLIRKVAEILDPAYANANAAFAKGKDDAEEAKWRETNAAEPIRINERLRLTATLPVIPYEEGLGNSVCKVVAVENVIVHYSGIDTVTGRDFGRYYKETEEADGGGAASGREAADGGEEDEGEHPTDWRASKAWKERLRLYARARVTESCAAKWYG